MRRLEPQPTSSTATSTSRKPTIVFLRCSSRRRRQGGNASKATSSRSAESPERRSLARRGSSANPDPSSERIGPSPRRRALVVGDFPKLESPVVESRQKLERCRALERRGSELRESAPSIQADAAQKVVAGEPEPPAERAVREARRESGERGRLGPSATEVSRGQNHLRLRAPGPEPFEEVLVENVSRTDHENVLAQGFTEAVLPLEGDPARFVPPGWQTRDVAFPTRDYERQIHFPCEPRPLDGESRRNVLRYEIRARRRGRRR